MDSAPLRSRDYLPRRKAPKTLRRPAVVFERPKPKRKVSTDQAPAPLPHLVLEPLFADAPPTEALQRDSRWGILYQAEAPLDDRMGFMESAPEDALTWEDVLSRVRRPAPGRHQEDVRAIEKHLRAHEWKAAAFVAGGLLEALLVEAAQSARAAVEAVCAAELGKSKRKQNDGARWDQPVERLGLYGLIYALVSCGELSAEEAATCTAARKSRNALLHGQRSVTEKEARGLAEAALLLLVRQCAA